MKPKVQTQLLTFIFLTYAVISQQFQVFRFNY
jgi:hypothetical protein